MNKRTIALALRFAMGRCKGERAWSIAAAYGSALAALELGDERKAHWYYTQAKCGLKYALRLGEFGSNRWRLSGGTLRGLEVSS